MFVCLLQIRTITWTIQRHLALFSTTLRADAPVNGGTKALFFSGFTDSAAQSGLPQHYGIFRRNGLDLGCRLRDLKSGERSWRGPDFNGIKSPI